MILINSVIMKMVYMIAIIIHRIYKILNLKQFAAMCCQALINIAAAAF